MEPSLCGALKVRRASADDLTTVLEIMAQAAAWLVKKGIDQWPSPPNEHWRRRIAVQVEAGEIYLSYEARDTFVADAAFADLSAGAAVGTLRITWDDPYWPAGVEPAGYVHALALADAYHGLGLGETLLSWAMAHIAGRGRRVIRLDCAAGNNSLREYYERLGFAYCRQVVDRDYVAALNELRF